MTAYAALAEPSRRQILDLLRDRERSVNELVDHVGLSQPGVSKHLKVLREAGLVDVRPAGKQRFYGLRAEPARRGRRLARAVPQALGRATRRARTPPGGEPMMTGTQETIDGRPALRFERRLTHSIERVWRAVSEPAELARWFVAPVSWIPEEGETFEAAGDTGRVTVRRSAHHPRLEVGRRALPLRAHATTPTAPRSSSPTSSAARSARTGSTPPAGRPTSTGSTRTSTAATSPRRTRTRTSTP